MNRPILFLATTATIAAFANPSVAHPGGGAGVGLGVGGPPASVTMGPPAAAMSHIPNGVGVGKPAVPPGQAAKADDTIGGGVAGSVTANVSTTTDSDPSVANAAAELGKLNAAHASPEALQHASPKSIVGAISAYKSATVTAQAAVNKYTTLVSQDNATVTADQVTLSNAQNALTALQNSTTATQAQLMTAQTAVTNAQTALNAATTQLTSDKASLASAQAAIVSAQTTLASRTNKPLTPTVIAQLNALLGI